ncbi:tail fiber domain-containing protein [bacterium]|nr:tail fiber domain-containing protein [bacterium]
MSFGDSGASDAAIDAAEIAADSQRESLDYLKEKERIPSWYSDQALNQLAGFYGLNQAPTSASIDQPQFVVNPAYGDPLDPRGDEPQRMDYFDPELGMDENAYNSALALYNSSRVFDPNAPAYIENPNYADPATLPQVDGQAEFVAGVKQDPFYQSMLTQGEEAILRSSAATGGLRSGTANEALAQSNQNVLNQLTQQKLAGLREFTGATGYESGIASAISGIGSTTAQGLTAAAQADADAQEAEDKAIMSTIGTIASLWSDPRLKTKIKKVGNKNGFNIYDWEWNETAKKLGLSGKGHGVMADEVQKIKPEAIGHEAGYMKVNYEMIGVQI